VSKEPTGGIVSSKLLTNIILTLCVYECTCTHVWRCSGVIFLLVSLETSGLNSKNEMQSFTDNLIFCYSLQIYHQQKIKSFRVNQMGCDGWYYIFLFLDSNLCQTAVVTAHIILEVSKK